MGSAVPPISLALLHSVQGRWQGWWASWAREHAEGLREEEALPRMSAGQGWKASSLVSEQCCPPMACCSAHSCPDTSQSQMLQRALDPTKKRRGYLMINWLLFLAQGLWNILSDDWSRRQSPILCPGPCTGPHPSPVFRSCFPLKFLGCGAHSSVNPFRGNATEKQEAEKFNWEHKYSFKNKPPNHNKNTSL